MLDIFQELTTIHKIIKFETDDSIAQMAKKIGLSRSHLNVGLKGNAPNNLLGEYAEKLKAAYKSEIEHFVSRWGKNEKAPEDREQLLNEILDRVKSIEINLHSLTSGTLRTSNQNRIVDIAGSEHKEADPIHEQVKKANRLAKGSKDAAKKKKENPGKD